MSDFIADFGGKDTTTALDKLLDIRCGTMSIDSARSMPYIPIFLSEKAEFAV